jgi:hypothetical protein
MLGSVQSQRAAALRNRYPPTSRASARAEWLSAVNCEVLYERGSEGGSVMHQFDTSIRPAFGQMTRLAITTRGMPHFAIRACTASLGLSIRFDYCLDMIDIGSPLGRAAAERPSCCRPPDANALRMITN